jgi:hypothetical protein
MADFTPLENASIQFFAQNPQFLGTLFGHFAGKAAAKKGVATAEAASIAQEVQDVTNALLPAVLTIVANSEAGEKK